jgi:hypothetical protein
MPGFHAALAGVDDILLRAAAFISTGGLVTVLKTAVFGVGLSIPDLIKAFHDMNDAMDEMKRKRDALLAGKPFKSFALPTGFLGPVGAGGLEAANFEGIAGSLNRFSPFADTATERLRNLHDAMIGIKNPLVDLSEQFKLLPNSTQITVTALTDVWKELELVQQKYQQIAEVADAAMGMLSAASASGILSSSAFARAQMAILAVQATMHGMYELAAAAASAASYQYHAAVLHKIAAGLYFATAAFEGAGAVRGMPGGSSAGGSGGGSFQSAALAAPPSQRSISVEVNVEGNAIFGEDKDKIGRDLAETIKRALQDGAAGGNL